MGIPGSPVAFQTEFGRVLAGGADCCTPTCQVTTHHVSGRQFWEVEEKPMADHAFTPDKHLAHDHFNNQCTHMSDGRFIVPLPRIPGTQLLGEIRSQAVRRLISF